MDYETPADVWEGAPVGAWQSAWNLPGLHAFEAVASTNDTAMQLAARGEAAGTTVIAEQQLAGRGRAGRSWIDASGRSLLFSVVMRGGRTVDPSVMPLRVGLAAARAIRATTGLTCQLKWPNDLVLPGRGKLGGILCEAASGAEDTWLVAGIGLNVGLTRHDFPDHLRDAATSLLLAGATTDRPGLLRAILDELRPFRIQPPPLDPATLDELRRVDALAGHDITVDGRFAGTALGIAPDGGLLIRSPTGPRSVRTGTVRFAEPDPEPARHDSAGPALPEPAP